MRKKSKRRKIYKLLKLKKHTLVNDTIAGITVALLLIPQSLAYASLAGLPPYYGLYASIIPTIIGAYVGSSPQLSTGPVAIISLMSLSAIAPLAEPGSTLFISYTITLAFIAGIILLIMGLLKMGNLISFLSHPVIYGFTNASALIIATTQLTTFFEVEVARQPRQYQTFLLTLKEAYFNTNFYTLGLGIGTLILMMALKKINKKIPYVLVAVVIGTIFAWYLKYPTAVVGNVPKGVAYLKIPELSIKIIQDLFWPAVTIALIGFTGNVSIAQSIAIKTKNKFEPNKELLGQSFANIAASLAQGFIVAGSFSRSAVNYVTGAKTWISSLLTGITVFIAAIFFTDLLYYLPKVVLAAIILTSVLGMIDLSKIQTMWQVSKFDATASVLTLLSTLYFAPELEKGILIGVAFSIGYFFYKNTHPRVAFLSMYKDKYFHDAEAYHLDVCESIAIVRLDAPLFFANANFFEVEVTNYLAKHKKITDILFVGTGINEIDATGEEILEKLWETLSRFGKNVYFSDMKRPVLKILKETDFIDDIGAENIFATTQTAVASIIAKLEHKGAHLDKRHCPLKKYREIPVDAYRGSKSERNLVAYVYEKLF